MKRFVLTLLAVLMLCLAADAKGKKDKKEAPPVDPAVEKEAKRQKALEKQVKVSLELFKKEFKSKSRDRRIQAVWDLAQKHHDLVIAELAKRPLYDRDAEVRDATAILFADFTFNVEKAGEALKKALPKNEDHPEVQTSIIRSIGKLKYKGALDELKEAAGHLNEEKYRWVTVEVVRTMGAIEDPACLPFLLWMSEYGGKALKWSTGSVTHDTGAAGTADQEAAEAKWKAKYGHVKPKRPPAPIIREYMQELQKTVKKLTGQEFRDATTFRKWLIANAEKYGLDPKALTKD